MQMEESCRRTLCQTLRSCPLDSLFNFPFLPDWSTITQPRPYAPQAPFPQSNILKKLQSPRRRR